ncbi:MAG: tetratricopeptide repeat protein [Acidobacteriota bacterium]
MNPDSVAEVRMYRNLVVLSFAFVGLAAAAGQAVDTALLAKAKGGDPAAQVAVGEQYARIAGAAQDPDDAADDWKQSADWYRRAAEQGDVPGEIHYAECYRDGRGVGRDMSKAAEWYRKAADQGDPSAQGTLAMLYSMGQGVPQSDVDAYFWFDLAAEVPSPNRERYVTNRQNVGTRITGDDLEAIRKREKQWKAAHPRGEQR